MKEKELTPSLPSCLGELERIAVTHGAEEDHCQCHQSQLHSPCCLPGHAGSPPCDQMDQGGGAPSSVGQVDPSAAGTDYNPSSLSLLWHSSCSSSVCLFLSPLLLCLSGSLTLEAAAATCLRGEG